MNRHNFYLSVFGFFFLTQLVTTGLTQDFSFNPELKQRVRGVYFTPADRPIDPTMHARLHTFIVMAQDFYSIQMARYGYLDTIGDGKTFELDRNTSDTWNVLFITGEQQHSWYVNHPDRGWESALDEMYSKVPEVYRRDNVVLYFYNTFTVDANMTLQNTANGGSGAPWEGEAAGYIFQGIHFMGNGFWTVPTDITEFDSIFQQSDSSGVKEFRWDNQYVELTRAEYASTYVGVALHELGHAFYLEHDFGDHDNNGIDNNLMGNGFRRFGGSYGLPGFSGPTVTITPANAAALNESLMFNQITSDSIVAY
jgi:hypothetical protein